MVRLSQLVMDKKAVVIFGTIIPIIHGQESCGTFGAAFCKEESCGAFGPAVYRQENCVAFGAAVYGQESHAAFCTIVYEGVFFKRGHES